MDPQRQHQKRPNLLMKLYLGCLFYYHYVIYFIQSLFIGNGQLANHPRPKEIIDGMMENLTGEDRLLINANESVEETFMRMIHEQEYDLALRLAKKFDLEIDLIYKNMWKQNQDKSIELIDECLTKITHSLWSLNECVNCIPKQLDVLKHLLKFGIELCKNNHLSVNQNDQESSEDGQQNIQQQFTQAKKTLENYLEKLKIYEIILKAKFGEDFVENFDAEFYGHFRQQSSFKSAIKFANKEDIDALSVLFKYEKLSLLPHVLTILSNLPETLSPNKYKDLIELGFEILLNEKYLEGEFDNFENDFYLDNIQYLKFKIDKNTNDRKDLITCWLEFRAREILDYTLLVMNSLELLQIGIEKQFPLEEFYAELDLYSVLIYDSLKTNVLFEDFEKLSITDKINLFLNNKDHFILIDSLFEKFFDKMNAYGKLKKFNFTRKDLLKNFFLNLTRVDFEQCLKIFEIYTMVNKTQEEIKCFKIINDPSDFIELALECINSYDGPENLSIAFKIMECLPDRDQIDILFGTDDQEKIARYNHVNDLADEVEYRLSMVELFNDYNTKLTVKDLNEIANGDNPKQIQIFIERLINNFCKMDIDDMEIMDEWKMFFLNLKDLKKKYLNIISDEELVETTVKCLLLSSKKKYIQIAFNHIDLESNNSTKKLNSEKGKQILKQVAKDYIKFSDPTQDNYVKLAKMCLELIHTSFPDDPDVNEELNFIQALKILYDEFDLQILPIKIKNMSEMDLIEAILSSSKDAHTKVDHILKISSLLNVFDDHSNKDEHEARILIMIGQKALEQGNGQTAIDLCNDIMNRNLKSAWTLCHQTCLLAPIDKLMNIEEQLRLLSFVLAHCPEQDIQIHYDLLNMIKQIKQIHINNITEQKVFINFRGGSNHQQEQQQQQPGLIGLSL